jgi:hypothetical protein
MEKHAPRTILAHAPMWLIAGLSEMPDGFRALLVFVSPLVRESDQVYQPVADFLGSHCHRLDSVDRVEDESMMFGEADALIYSIFPDCPGPLVTHECN